MLVSLQIQTGLWTTCQEKLKLAVQLFYFLCYDGKYVLGQGWSMIIIHISGWIEKSDRAWLWCGKVIHDSFRQHNLHWTHQYYQQVEIWKNSINFQIFVLPISQWKCTKGQQAANNILLWPWMFFQLPYFVNKVDLNKIPLVQILCCLKVYYCMRTREKLLKNKLSLQNILF